MYTIRSETTSALGMALRRRLTIKSRISIDLSLALDRVAVCKCRSVIVHSSYRPLHTLSMYLNPICRSSVLSAKAGFMMITPKTLISIGVALACLADAFFTMSHCTAKPLTDNPLHDNNGHFIIQFPSLYPVGQRSCESHACVCFFPHVLLASCMRGGRKRPLELLPGRLPTQASRAALAAASTESLLASSQSLHSWAEALGFASCQSLICSTTLPTCLP